MEQNPGKLMCPLSTEYDWSGLWTNAFWLFPRGIGRLSFPELFPLQMKPFSIGQFTITCFCFCHLYFVDGSNPDVIWILAL